jgi:glutathione peroxidase
MNTSARIDQCPCRVAARAAPRSGRTLRWFIAAILVAGVLGAVAPPAAAEDRACPSLLDRTALRLQDEQPQQLCQFAGRVVLVVNTASFCGFTPQYRSLETLYDRYRERGFVVLGFPSNDFGAQEPGDNRQIADFCENTFGVRFPMFAKTRVRPGAGVDPLFAELARRTGESPRWNFHKFLIDRDGKQVISVPSDVDPLTPSFVRTVEKLLVAN